MKIVIDFRVRGREGEIEGEGERNIGVREKHGFMASYTFPDLGSHPQPRYVP